VAIQIFPGLLHYVRNDDLRKALLIKGLGGGQNFLSFSLINFVNLENQNYLVTVEQFFLTLKDSGLALSATDYDLIQQWESRGIPVHVVCRGIENGIAEFDKQNTRQSSRMGLSYLKVYVEEEMERSLS